MNYNNNLLVVWQDVCKFVLVFEAQNRLLV